MSKWMRNTGTCGRRHSHKTRRVLFWRGEVHLQWQQATVGRRSPPEAGRGGRDARGDSEEVEGVSLKKQGTDVSGDRDNAVGGRRGGAQGGPLERGWNC